MDSWGWAHGGSPGAVSGSTPLSTLGVPLPRGPDVTIQHPTTTQASAGPSVAKCQEWGVSSLTQPVAGLLPPNLLALSRLGRTLTPWPPCLSCPPPHRSESWAPSELAQMSCPALPTPNQSSGHTARVGAGWTTGWPPLDATRTGLALAPFPSQASPLISHGDPPRGQGTGLGLYSEGRGGRAGPRTSFTGLHPGGLALSWTLSCLSPL